MAATPLRTLYADLTFGLEMTLHLEPSQCSISVFAGLVLLSESPTAQISWEEIATTPVRSLRNDPTLGLETILHLMPFQCSISVFPELVLLLKEFPTAHMLLAETADTETRSLPDDATFGLVTTLQVVPSQCSISV